MDLIISSTYVAKTFDSPSGKNNRKNKLKKLKKWKKNWIIYHYSSCKIAKGSPTFLREDWRQLRLWESFLRQESWNLYCPHWNQISHRSSEVVSYIRFNVLDATQLQLCRTLCPTSRDKTYGAPEDVFTSLPTYHSMCSWHSVSRCEGPWQMSKSIKVAHSWSIVYRPTRSCS